jgi:phosphopantetheine--protein transferase-like protein
MQEKIKEIISVFIRVPAGKIGPDTAIGRTALGSSIMLHRMYARLAEEGLTVNDYLGIKQFADLQRQMGGGSNGQQLSSADLNTFRPDLDASPSDLQSSSNGQPISTLDPYPSAPAFFLPSPSFSAPATNPGAGGIGIDMEEIAALPRTHDFRKAEFYKMNFSAEEIAYCVLQADPYSSFAGLFAAKEAIVKADNRYRRSDFHTIGIGHSPEGKPFHPAFHLSIAHAGTMAVAVAVPSGVLPSVDALAFMPARTSTLGESKPSVGDPRSATNALSAANGRAALFWLACIALLLSVIALVLALNH